MGLTTVRLYGSLRRKFGKEYRLAVSSPAEAIRALCTLVAGFKEHLREHSRPGYRVIVDGEAQSEEDLRIGKPFETMRLVPVVVASKEGGMQMVFGAALIAIGSVVSAYGAPAIGSAIAKVGWAMMIGGAAQLLSPAPGMPMTPENDPGGTPTYTFTGPINTTAQGHCIPVCYGKMRVGSAVLSVGVSAEAFTKLGGSDGLGNRVGNGDTTPWAWSINPAV